MRFNRLLMVLALAGLATGAWAQDFGLDIGSFSDPLTGAPIFVDGAGGGTFAYYNSTSDVITELEFAVNVGAGLAPNASALTTLLNGYNCNPFEFFATCSKSYDNSSGVLFLDFSGTSPDGDEVFTGDPETHNSEGDEVYAPEGIPTLPTEACLSTPDAAGCTTSGHFLISFNTFGEGGTFNANNDGGTWAPNTQANLYKVNDVLVPEPSSLAFLGIALLLAASIRGRAAWQRRKTVAYRVRPGR